MGTFIPEWPLAVDTVPTFEDNKTAVVGQWFNIAQTLIEVLEAEIGLDIVHGTNTLKSVLDTLTYSTGYSASYEGLPRGFKYIKTTQAGSWWGAGSNTVTFTATVNHPNPVLKQPVCFGIGETTNVNGMMILAHPFSVGFLNEQYWIAASHTKSTVGMLGGASTFTGRLILMSPPEYDA